MSESHKDKNYLNHETTIWSWLTTIDHKRIALMYLFAMTFFFFVGGISALLVRTELFSAGADFLNAKQYNMLFTIHGAVMVFLFIVPGIPAIMGNFLIPLMIGAKDVAFPRLNLLSYYIYLLGAFMALLALIGPSWGDILSGIFANIGLEGLSQTVKNVNNFLFNNFGGFFDKVGLTGPVDTGWTFYAPYSLGDEAGGTTSGVIWMTGAAFVLGFSSILTGLNFIVTIHKLRAPGMTWWRLPVFIWASYATAIIQTLATPIVGISLLLLIMEQAFGVGIFNPKMGGDPVLFEHLFWFYSHPVVYIMVLPAFGVIGEIIPVFSRKPIFGYKMVCLASLGIAIIGFVVWAHHMFVSGISDTAAYIFSFLTFFVAVPTAIKVFNWVSTMYRGSISFRTPMLYAMAFVFLFMIAGTTGIYLATLAVDVFYHDTYFVVAHFHYTMQGGAVIGLIAALHFWFPKITGKMYSELSANIGFIFIFIGFNLTFLPQFVLGMQGMPRRYFDYPVEFEFLHSVSTVGSYLNAFGYSFALFNLLYFAVFGKTKASDNPYESLSLEWKTKSPPIHENFSQEIIVTDWTYGYGKKEG